MKFANRNRTQPSPRKTTVGFIGIRTRIVGVEGEHADHLTTIMSPPYYKVPIFFLFSRSISLWSVLRVSQSRLFKQKMS